MFCVEIFSPMVPLTVLINDRFTFAAHSLEFSVVGETEARILHGAEQNRIDRSRSDRRNPGASRGTERAGDIVLFDIAEGRRKVRPWILRNQVRSRFQCGARWANSYESDCWRDVVIVTAGVPRKPRDEPRRSARHQPQGHGSGRRGIKHYAPGAFVSASPISLDAMVWALAKNLAFSGEQIVGMGGRVLDSARSAISSPRNSRSRRRRHRFRSRRPRR